MCPKNVIGERIVLWAYLDLLFDDYTHGLVASFTSIPYLALGTTKD